MMTSITLLEGQFLDGSFSRNNRSTGQKSMRCFPRCCDGGHNARGFCGTSIFATAVFPKTLPIENVIVIGEIRPESEPGLAQDVGTKFPKEDILRRVRSEKKNSALTQMLLAGIIHVLNADETADTYSASIVLNKSLHSYDYAWKSSKWSADTRHVVDIVVFSDDSLRSFDGSSTLTVLGSVCSNSFLVLSTKSSKSGTAVPEEGMTGKKRKGTSNKIKPGKFAGREGSVLPAVNFHASASSLSCTTMKTSPTTDDGTCNLFVTSYSSLIFSLCLRKVLQQHNEHLPQALPPVALRHCVSPPNHSLMLQLLPFNIQFKYRI